MVTLHSVSSDYTLLVASAIIELDQNCCSAVQKILLVFHVTHRRPQREKYPALTHFAFLYIFDLFSFVYCTSVLTTQILLTFRRQGQVLHM